MPSIGGDHPHGGNDRIGTLFDVLKDEHSRHVLFYFQSSSDDVATVDDLVDDAVRREPSRDRERIAVRFHHVTLPKLAGTGLIAYDRRSEFVRYRGSPLLEGLLGQIRRTVAVE